MPLKKNTTPRKKADTIMTIVINPIERSWGLCDKDVSKLENNRKTRQAFIISV
jgi:hypothetical protein